MKKSLLLITALANVLSVVTSQSSEPATVLPQTATVPTTSSCSQDDQTQFIFGLPDPVNCGLGLATVFLPPGNDTRSLDEALENVCTRDCGGRYANFLDTVCDDRFISETMRIYCTRTNGTAAVGDYCRYASGDIADPSLTNALIVCENFTIDNPCAPGCRNALMRLKSQIGCCYQSLYNNTVYTTELMNGGFITPSQLALLQHLSNPVTNPWAICGVRPPRRCRGEPFPDSPETVTDLCTLQDQIDFVSTLPNPGTCGPSLQTIFPPVSNDSALLARALDSVCTSDCGGSYSNFLEKTCEDELGAEALRLYCTPTNGSANVGSYCRYAIEDSIDLSILSNLQSCDNSTEEQPCAPGCRRALRLLKNEIGCCYQSVYNNTRYNTLILNARFITQTEFNRRERLGDPENSPWVLCGIDPPQNCPAPPFQPPTQPECTIEDQTEFISRLPNPVECGLGLATAFLPPGNDTSSFNEALDNVCTADCGGRYANFLDTVCDDTIASETLRVYCTPTNRTAAVGEYCRYAVIDIADLSLITALTVCENYTIDNPCAPGCRNALMRLKSQIGCCYQSLYNNTVYTTELMNAGYITPSELAALQYLNDPATSPWAICGVRPPRRCQGEPFPQETVTLGLCTLEDQIAFVSTFPNAETCGLGINTIFSPPANDSTALARAINNVCNNECGGRYFNFLEYACKDDLGAESLRVFCSPTNGTANVGSYCRYAVGDILDLSLFNDLSVCSNYTEEQPCAPGCRQALLRLKNEVGCCYQRVHNNTFYNTLLLNAGFITQTDFTVQQLLNDPIISPWNVCGVDPPQNCPAPPFEPPAQPVCDVQDNIDFFSTVPNAAVCGPSIGAVFGNDSTALTLALDNVCNRDCGGAYFNFLKSDCNDDFASETLRLYCTRTNGTAAVGEYCRYAAGDILNQSVLDDLKRCNITEEQPCTSGCRRALLRLRNQVGCCYQNVYNNTFYNTLLLGAGFLTPSDFTGLVSHNNPFYNPWNACNVSAPQRCSADPFPRERGCPRGTYRRDRTCEPCPDNTDISMSGRNATICPCLRGYFRAETEGPSDRCSPPPDACRNIHVRQRGSRNITLSWTKPTSTGRNDFYYLVDVSDGDTLSRYSFEDRRDRVEEVVGGLRPDTEYTFTVTVHNGVSEQDLRNENLRQCELTTTTEEAMPSTPVEVQAFCAAVGWRLPRTPNGQITRYDVQLTVPGFEEDILISTGKDATFVAVDKDYQVYGATVRVRARTSAGPGPWSRERQLGCEETTETTCPPCDCPTTSEPTPAGVHFILGGQIYQNNSVAPLSQVGEGDNALLCRTDKVDCCSTRPNRFGNFYYPNGATVQVSAAGENFYRNRGEGEIRLHRRGNALFPNGRFRCEIPDASGETQNIFINLVT